MASVSRLERSPFHQGLNPVGSGQPGASSLDGARMVVWLFALAFSLVVWVAALYLIYPSSRPAVLGGDPAWWSGGVSTWESGPLAAQDAASVGALGAPLRLDGAAPLVRLTQVGSPAA